LGLTEKILFSYPYLDIFAANVKAITYARVVLSRQTISSYTDPICFDFRDNQTEPDEIRAEIDPKDPQYSIAYRIIFSDKPISLAGGNKMKIKNSISKNISNRTQLFGADLFLINQGVNQLE
jgi:hypothetical protein